jgi:uncharacterized protein (TIGR02147 family)
MKPTPWAPLPGATYQELVDGLFAAARQKLGRRSSLRSVAVALGQASPSAVHAMARGHRLLSTTVQTKLIELLALTTYEAELVRGWVNYERKVRDGTATDGDRRRLERLDVRAQPAETTSAATFRYIAEWHHLPLKTLVSSRSFRHNLDWIGDRLRGKLPAAKIVRALQVLEQLGFIAREGRSWRVLRDVATALDVPSAAVRRHHVEMMTRAAEAVEELPVEERDMSSLTLLFDRRRLPEAKAALEAFRREFVQHFEDATADDVFQLNMQLFAHTAPVAPAPTARVTAPTAPS